MSNHILKRLINDDKDNIRNVAIPFSEFLATDTEDKITERKTVVFLGANFRDLPGADFNKIMRISDLCLDYVRRECKGYDLYYKPHPAETDEADFLNLFGFKITSKVVSELFFIQNAKKIKYIFSVCSTGNILAYKMGFNSYTFTNMAIKVFDEKTAQGYKEFFKEMPPECFIDSFNAPLKENRIRFSSDKTFEENIKNILTQKNGPVWLIIGDPATLARVIVMTWVIKKIDPQRIVNLIIEKHHRWGVVPIDEVRIYFDNLFFVPRIFYSLRPIKIAKAIKAAFRIRKFPIKPEDIVIQILGHDFAFNCFTSYFRNNLQVFILRRETFEMLYEERNYDKSIFRTRPGAKFFSFILEPVLGLERTWFLEDTRRVHNVYRYLRPVNDIFDYIWLF